VENRNGLIAAARVTHADGYAERDAALLMLKEKQEGHARRTAVGTDKACDMKDFVRTARELNATHACDQERQRAQQQSGLQDNAAAWLCQQPELALAGREKEFGWLKQTGPLRQVKLQGLEKADWLFAFSRAAPNLLRLLGLVAQRQTAKLQQSCA
jgi:hypothetical protein